MGAASTRQQAQCGLWNVLHSQVVEGKRQVQLR